MSGKIAPPVLSVSFVVNPSTYVRKSQEMSGKIWGLFIILELPRVTLGGSRQNRDCPAR